MAKTIFGIDVNEFKKFSRGKEGVVYRGPDNMLLKVYANSGRCISEYKLLKRMEGSPYFPKAFKCKGVYMLREYVDGTLLVDYIRENGLSKTLANNLIDLSEFFYNTKYLRIDGIDKHVFVCENERLMVIDPRRKKYRFHKSLLGLLIKLGKEDVFLKELIKNKPELVSQWYEKENIDFNKYKGKGKNLMGSKVDENIDKKTNSLDKRIYENYKLYEEGKVEGTEEQENQMDKKPIIGFLNKIKDRICKKL